MVLYIDLYYLKNDRNIWENSALLASMHFPETKSSLSKHNKQIVCKKPHGAPRRRLRLIERAYIVFPSCSKIQSIAFALCNEVNA